jgi:hypothetical protein
MPDFIIRKIPDAVFAAFKDRAKTEGRVMKAILIRLMARWALDGDEPRNTKR